MTDPGGSLVPSFAAAMTLQWITRKDVLRVRLCTRGGKIGYVFYFLMSSSFFWPPVSFFSDPPRPSSKFFLTMLMVRPLNTITSLTTMPTSPSITASYSSLQGLSAASPSFALRSSFNRASMSTYIPAHGNRVHVSMRLQHLHRSSTDRRRRCWCRAPEVSFFLTRWHTAASHQVASQETRLQSWAPLPSSPPPSSLLPLPLCESRWGAERELKRMYKKATSASELKERWVAVEGVIQPMDQNDKGRVYVAIGGVDSFIRILLPPKLPWIGQ